VYAEHRITEVLEGADLDALDAVLGRRELERAIERFADRPELTRLRTHLAGIDPDDAYSQVPYEKGYLFLLTLEQAVGRDAFTRWLRTYLAAFRFQAITTDDFTAHFEGAFPGVLAQVDAATWIDGEGIPADAPRPRSAKLSAIEALGGGVPEAAAASAWTALEWQVYLESVPRPAPADVLRALDERFALTRSTNYDVLAGWLQLALESGYHAVVPRTEEVLGAVGRMKYLRPLYTALAKDPQTREVARRAFERNRAGYHPIAQQVVDSVLRETR